MHRNTHRNDRPHVNTAPETAARRADAGRFSGIGELVRRFFTESTTKRLRTKKKRLKNAVQSRGSNLWKVNVKNMLIGPSFLLSFFVRRSPAESLHLKIGSFVRVLLSKLNSSGLSWFNFSKERSMRSIGQDARNSPEIVHWKSFRSQPRRTLTFQLFRYSRTISKFEIRTGSGLRTSEIDRKKYPTFAAAFGALVFRVSVFRYLVDLYDAPLRYSECVFDLLS